jgi:hypothetical protein
MRTKRILNVLVIGFIGFAFLFAFQAMGQSKMKIKGKKYQPCGIRLNSLSHTSGAPGDVFKLYGSWGPTQGTKIPCINKGGMNRLIVLHWSSSAIKVKIPAGLLPGAYKVGVYCNELSEGGSYSSGWKDFKVIKKSNVDVDVADIYVDKKCRLWVKHYNRGTEPINKVLREKVWVNRRLIDNSTETVVIQPGRFYAHGILADPGYIVRGTVTVKIQIDVDNVLAETNERNNTLTKRVTCRMFPKPAKKLNLKSKQLNK